MVECDIEDVEGDSGKSFESSSAPPTSANDNVSKEISPANDFSFIISLLCERDMSVKDSMESRFLDTCFLTKTGSEFALLLLEPYLEDL